VKVSVIVNTYNRPDQCRRLVEQLNRQSGNHTIKVVLNDDGSQKPYANKLKGVHGKVKVEVFTHVNHGKRRYWELVTKTFKQVKGDGSDYIVYTADDLTIGPEFISTAIRSFERIPDRGKICLSYIMLKSSFGKSNWTGHKPKAFVFDGVPYHWTQWTDMAFICTHRMLAQLDYRVMPIPLTRWSKDPTLGSGVGKDISQRLVAKRFNLYHLVKSIASFKNPTDSEMNKESRRLHPAITI